MKSYPESPENTPPPTPTAPSSGSQHSGKSTSGSLGNGSAGQDSAKTKQRKRKKVSDEGFVFLFSCAGWIKLLSLLQRYGKCENVLCFSHNSDF